MSIVVATARIRALAFPFIAAIALTACASPAATPAAPTDAARSDAAVPSPAASSTGGESSERYATLGFENELLALGITPVAAGTPYTGEWYPHIEDALADTEAVGTWFEPNVEALLAAEPEVLVAGAFVEADYGAQLAAIPEVHYVEASELGGSAGAAATLLNVASVLDMEEEAQQVIEEHEQLLADARERLADVDGTVAFIRVCCREYRVVTIDHGYIGPVLYDDLGLTPPPFIEELNQQDTESNGYVPLSIELVGDIDADHIFFLAEGDSTDLLDDLTSSPLWSESTAVQNGQTYAVDPVYWQTTAILADQAKVRDVLEHLDG